MTAWNNSRLTARQHYIIINLQHVLRRVLTNDCVELVLAHALSTMFLHLLLPYLKASQIIKERRMRWFGHVLRMGRCQIAKQVCTGGEHYKVTRAATAMHS